MKVTHETEEGDMLYAVACEAKEELGKAQKDQDRLHDEMEGTCERMVAASKEYTTCWANLNGAFREANNRRALHVEACADLKKVPEDCRAQATFSQRTLQKSNQRTYKI